MESSWFTNSWPGNNNLQIFQNITNRIFLNNSGMIETKAGVKVRPDHKNMQPLKRNKRSSGSPESTEYPDRVAHNDQDTTEQGTASQKPGGQ